MITITIVSPEKTLFSGEAEVVKVPGVKGAFEILANHAPIISILGKGKVECKGTTPFELEIRSGFVEVSKNVVSICVEV